MQRLSAYVENHIAFSYRASARHACVEHGIAQPVARKADTDIADAHGLRKELRAILRDGAEAGVFGIDDTGPTAMALIQMMTGVIVWFRPGERRRSLK